MSLKAVGVSGQSMVPSNMTRGYREFSVFDDKLIDYFLERSPKLIKEYRQIRARIAAGRFVTHTKSEYGLGRSMVGRLSLPSRNAHLLPIPKRRQIASHDLLTSREFL